MQFYTDLLARAQQLFQTVNDYSFTRGVEKKDLILSMHQEDEIALKTGNMNIMNNNNNSPGYGTVPHLPPRASQPQNPGYYNQATSSGPPPYASVVIPPNSSNNNGPPPYAAINYNGPYSKK